MYDEAFDERVDDKATRGADGRPISRGNVVRVPPYFSEALGVEIPERRGRVVEVYRDHFGRVLVDAWDGGSRTFLASRCRRSQGKVKEVARQMEDALVLAKTKRKGKK